MSASCCKCITVTSKQFCIASRWVPCIKELLKHHPFTSSCLLVSLKDFSNDSIWCILARSASSWPCSSLTCSSLSGSVLWGSPPREATCLWVSFTCSRSIRMFWLNLQTHKQVRINLRKIKCSIQNTCISDALIVQIKSTECHYSDTVPRIWQVHLWCVNQYLAHVNRNWGLTYAGCPFHTWCWRHLRAGLLPGLVCWFQFLLLGCDWASAAVSLATGGTALQTFCLQKSIGKAWALRWKAQLLPRWTSSWVSSEHGLFWPPPFVPLPGIV